CPLKRSGWSVGRENITFVFCRRNVASPFGSTKRHRARQSCVQTAPGQEHGKPLGQDFKKNVDVEDGLESAEEPPNPKNADHEPVHQFRLLFQAALVVLERSSELSRASEQSAGQEFIVVL